MKKTIQNIFESVFRRAISFKGKPLFIVREDVHLDRIIQKVYFERSFSKHWGKK